MSCWTAFIGASAFAVGFTAIVWAISEWCWWYDARCREEYYARRQRGQMALRRYQRSVRARESAGEAK